MIHNHPNTSLKPSKNDIYLTKQMSEAGKIMGINLLDHIIVNDKNFSSLLD